MGVTTKTVTVTNTAMTTVERGGRLFPPRSTITVEVSGPRLAEITAATMLLVKEVPEPESDTMSEEEVEEFSVVTDPELREEQAVAAEDENSEDYGALTVAQLKQRADLRGIEGNANMRKAELVEALQEYDAREAEQTTTPTVVGGVEQ